MLIILMGYIKIIDDRHQAKQVVQCLAMHTPLKLETTWKSHLENTFDLPYMQKLRSFLNDELNLGKIIYPRAYQYFNALNLTPFAKVKVVILGQDPYHGEGQAHGLCFSVPPDVRIPPSLVNIYKELHQDLGLGIANHGCLVHWANQGVLLLNSVLTVEQSKAASHQKQGWEIFTDKIIATINEEKEHVVFILWGAYAQKKGSFIDTSKHLVIHGVHPSPLSAHRGFFGQKYFSRTNAYLAMHGHAAIDWSLPRKDEAEQSFQYAEAMGRAIYK